MKNRFIKICIVCFITGLIISALAFVSFFGKLRDTKTESVTHTAKYIIDTLKEVDGNSIATFGYDDEGISGDSDNQSGGELYEVSVVPLDELPPEAWADTILEYAHEFDMTQDSIEDVFVYSIPEGTFYGEEDPLLMRHHPEKSEVKISDGYIYTPYPYSQDITLWFRNSAEPIKTEFDDYIIGYSFIFIISFIIVCLILALIMRHWTRNPKAIRGAYITLFVWIIAMYGIFAIGMAYVSMEYDEQYTATRMKVIDSGVRTYLDIPDNEIEESYEWIIAEDPRYADIPAETINDKRGVLLKATIDYDDEIVPSSMIFTPRENIWDTDVPIESRVDAEWNIDKYSEMLIDYLLQTIMIGVFAALLMAQILSLDNSRTFISTVKPQGIDESRFALLVHDTSNMKHLLIVKSFATALIAVLHMSMVKSWLSHDYGICPSAYVTTVIFASSLLGCLTVFVVPQVYKLCKNSMNYVRATLPICVAGSLVCFFARNSTAFITGYLIIAVGDGFANMTMIVYAMSHRTESEGMYALKQVSTSAIIGSILGAVVGGVLAIVIDNRYMYLIAAICMVAMVFYSFTISADSVNRKLPERTEMAKILHNREAIFFFVLIMIPFGFQSYFFTYKVSIDAADMGLTTVVVSFVYFVRNTFKLLVKNSDSNKKFWRKFPLKITAPLCLILSSMIFLAYIPFENIWGLIIVSVALAYVEASLNSRIYAYNFVLLDSDADSTFGNSAMIVSGRRIGKTLATMLVQGLSPVILPIVMFAGGSVYLIQDRIRKH